MAHPRAQRGPSRGDLVDVTPALDTCRGAKHFEKLISPSVRRGPRHNKSEGVPPRLRLKTCAPIVRPPPIKIHHVVSDRR
ncbi:hypothetical protein GBA52_015797 [Prunus armeniaca]|nr:hypothetical protein GBA52_015797 [Prunus armeniaca]